MPRAVGTLGTIDTVTVGGRVFTDLTNLITLYAGATANKVTTARLPAGSSGYAPGGGKSFYIKAIKITVYNNTTGEWPLFGYADTDLGLNSGAATINPVFPAGDAVNGGLSISVDIVGTFDIPFDFVVPTGKFLFCSASVGSSIGVAIYGYEV